MNSALYATIANYGMDVLRIGHLADYVDIEYVPRKYVEEWGTTGITRRRTAQLYEIRIATQWGDEDVADAVLHELRHVWQLETGLLQELTENGREISIWKGRITNQPYANQPHERDARAFAAYHVPRALQRVRVGTGSGVQLYRIRGSAH